MLSRLKSHQELRNLPRFITVISMRFLINIPWRLKPWLTLYSDLELIYKNVWSVSLSYSDYKSDRLCNDVLGRLKHSQPLRTAVKNPTSISILLYSVFTHFFALLRVNCFGMWRKSRWSWMLEFSKNLVINAQMFLFSSLYRLIVLLDITEFEP